jgi:hypothetical protein
METTFPGNIQDMFSYLTGVVTHINNEQLRLGIDSTRVATLNSIMGDTATPGSLCYLKMQWDNKTSGRTIQVTTDLRTRTEDAKGLLKEIYNDIPASKWSNADRAVFRRKTGLPKVSTHRRDGIQQQCFARPKDIGGGKIKVVCYADSEGSRASLPEGADSVMAAYSVIDPVDIASAAASGNELSSKVKAPRSATECSERLTISRSTINLDLGPDSSGKKLYLFLRWYNTKHPELAGPWSSAMIVNIG